MIYELFDDDQEVTANYGSLQIVVLDFTWQRTGDALMERSKLIIL